MMQTSMTDMLRTPTQIIENTYNLYCNPQGKRRLPDGFVPGPYDVICARGKKAHDSEGNVRFRALVDQHQAEYAGCTCKHEKSKIVSYIVNSIRSAAAYHQGGFVKNVDGLWFEVGDRAAKEKIGQTFRDLLHTKYSSSTKAKAKARIQKRVEEYNHTHKDEVGDHRAQSPPAPEKPQSTNPLSVPLNFPSLKKFGSLRNSAKEKLGLSFLNNFNPDKPYSEKALLETLRSSVQTVDYSTDEMMMSSSTLQMATDEDWMRLSATGDVKSSVKSSLRNPFMSSTANQNMVASQDIEEIVDAYMGDSATPYGIFSSSTRSNPFATSITAGTGEAVGGGESSSPNRGGARTRASIVASSVNSINNPLLMSSTRSSFMDMDLDGLLDGMDSMSMLKDVDEEL